MSARPCLLLLPLLACASRPEPVPTRGEDRQQRIDALVSTYVANHLFSGNVLVVHADRVVFQESYGLADREWNAPIDAETRFRIGSLTKQFTAMLVMQLRQEGKLALGAHVTDYLSWYPREHGERITIEALLTHTSGIPNYTEDDAAIDDILAHELSPEELARKHCTRAPEFEPGTRFRYCNTGYFLLGLVIETLTHKPYAQVLQERILDPAGMKDTGMDEPERLLARRASGYDYDIDGYRNASFVKPAAAYGAAGGMYSTCGDLWRWQEAFHGDVLLSGEGRELMCTPHLGNYGFGLYVSTVPSSAGTGTSTVLGHNGTLSGFTSSMLRYVEDDILVILLDNTRAWGRCNPENIAAGIVDVLRGKEPPAPVLSLKVALGEQSRSTDGAGVVRLYRRLREEKAAYDFSAADVTLNNLGYRLLQVGRVADALALLTCCTEEFPARDYAWDSLGEAQMKNGDEAAARKSFAKALDLNPANENAKTWLGGITGGHEQ